MDDEVDGSLVAACVDGQLRAFEGGSGVRPVPFLGLLAVITT